MKKIKNIFASIAILSLIGCGSGSEDSELVIPTYSAPTDVTCENSSQDINWEKLLLANAEKLSEYKLFQSQCNPTENPNTRGLPYDLSIPLFSDYTSKYRFIFVPENQKIDYVENEAFEFPVGSVIAKTFSMPATTDNRGYLVENLIETRLLINGTNGWTAHSYVWDEDKLDATKIRDGVVIPTVLGHGDDIIAFDYGVPTQSDCTECHQIKTGETKSIFSPIGPKARYLNSNYDYPDGGLDNQIEKWVSEGLLDASTVPEAGSREQAKTFNDYVDVDAIPPSEVEEFAKGWLDINCAHCHRTVGSAGNTAFKTSSVDAFQGFCEVPVSGAGTGSLVIFPGNAESSLVYQRLNTTDDGFSMPPIGRSAIHKEGTALVARWINSLSTPTCD